MNKHELIDLINSSNRTTMKVSNKKTREQLENIAVKLRLYEIDNRIPMAAVSITDNDDIIAPQELTTDELLDYIKSNNISVTLPECMSYKELLMVCFDNGLYKNDERFWFSMRPKWFGEYIKDYNFFDENGNFIPIEI